MRSRREWRRKERNLSSKADMGKRGDGEDCH